MNNSSFIPNMNSTFYEENNTSVPVPVSGCNNTVVSHDTTNQMLYYVSSQSPCQTTTSEYPARTAKMEYIPGGVAYTFTPTLYNYRNNLENPSPTSYNIPSYPTQRQIINQPNTLTLEQQIALKQLEQQELEILLLQEKLRKTRFVNKFHTDKNTSTSDFIPPFNYTMILKSDEMDQTPSISNVETQTDPMKKTVTFHKYTECRDEKDQNCDCNKKKDEDDDHLDTTSEISALYRNSSTLRL